MHHPTDIECALAALALRGDVLDPETAVRLITEARTTKTPLASLLLDRIPETKLLAALAEELDMPFVDLFSKGSTYTVHEPTVQLADINQLIARRALPLRGPDGQVVVAMANPKADGDMVDYLRSRYENMTVALASGNHIQQKLALLDTADLSGLAPADRPTRDATPAPASAMDNPVVEWVDTLLARAAAEDASDVHFRFNANGTLDVRFRVDGTLRRQAVPAPLRGREPEIVGSLLAKCSTVDPSDKLRAQDGTFSFLAAGARQLDARLAMLPQQNGPTVVVRILDPRNAAKRIDDLGFGPETIATMRAAMRRTKGLVLLVGPTGSGKTSTQVGMINELDRDAKNILTVEDPVEYRLEGVGQTQIRAGLGEKSLTFEKALRAILRLDPDVILVGEIRDKQTAEVAMHAALTGHLVLSTLHANTALGVVTRLADLDVLPYAISEALILAVSQRLIRRVHECASLEPPTAAEAAFLASHGLEVPERVAHAAEHGCAGCAGTGYRGRIPVVEVLAPDADVRTLIGRRATQDEVLAAAHRSASYTSILADAHRHVMAGTTTVAELLHGLDTGGA